MTPSVRLVLVPGTRFAAEVWEPYRDLLPDVEVVPVDLPGHGARLGEPFTADAAVAIIDDAVTGADPSQRVVVAGHSLGGYMALLYAARAGRDIGVPAGDGTERIDSRPDALVLLGVTADPASHWAVLYRGFARVVPVVGPERMAWALNTGMRLLGVRGEEAARLPDGSAYAVLTPAWNSVMDECRPDLLDDVRCPVVLANGQFDQMRIHVRRYADHCRDPHVVTIPGATHLAPITHRRQVAEVLREGVRLAQVG